MVKIREVSHTLVRADRETVLRVLPAAPSAGAGGPNGPVEVHALDEDGNESWYVLRDAPGGGTRLVHGAAFTPRSLREGVFSRALREELHRHVEEELEVVKRAAETLALLRPGQAP